MDKIVTKVLRGFLSIKQIGELQKRLWDEHCIIYHSELPGMNEIPIQHIDATPNKGYPLRILQAYRQDCDCRWGEDTGGSEPTNPLLKQMNEQCDQRAKILDEAINKLK